jgi:hypothetical protein
VRQLVSKIVAGGLSAAVILLWWPRFFPAETAVTWIARGVAWTAFFELMLLALAPLEAALWESRALRRVRERAAATGARRISAAGMRSRTALACTALAVPAALLLTAPAPRHEAPRTAVKQVTEVRKVVRVERRVAPAGPGPAPVTMDGGPAAAGPSASTAPAASVVTRRQAQPQRRSQTRRSSGRTRTAPAPDRSTDTRTGAGSRGTSQSPEPQQPAEPRGDAAQRAALA